MKLIMKIHYGKISLPSLSYSHLLHSGFVENAIVLV